VLSQSGIAPRSLCTWWTKQVATSRKEYLRGGFKPIERGAPPFAPLSLGRPCHLLAGDFSLWPATDGIAPLCSDAAPLRMHGAPARSIGRQYAPMAVVRTSRSVDRRCTQGVMARTRRGTDQHTTHVAVVRTSRNMGNRRNMTLTHGVMARTRRGTDQHTTHVAVVAASRNRGVRLCMQWHAQTQQMVCREMRLRLVNPNLMALCIVFQSCQRALSLPDFVFSSMQCYLHLRTSSNFANQQDCTCTVCTGNIAHSAFAIQTRHISFLKRCVLSRWRVWMGLDGFAAWYAHATGLRKLRAAPDLPPTCCP